MCICIHIQSSRKKINEQRSRETNKKTHFSKGMSRGCGERRRPEFNPSTTRYRPGNTPGPARWSIRTLPSSPEKTGEQTSRILRPLRRVGKQISSFYDITSAPARLAESGLTMPGAGKQMPLGIFTHCCPEM